MPSSKSRRFEEDEKKEEDEIMSFAAKHNKESKPLFTYKQAEDATFTRCKELYEHGYTEEKQRHVVCRGLFIVPARRFGDTPVMVCDGFNVNLPGHMLQDVRDIMADPEAVEDINAGKVGAYTYEYTNKLGTLSYGIRWVDLPGDAISNADLPY